MVREPLARLWSIYQFIQTIGGERDGRGKWEPAYVERQRRAVDRPFEEWLIENELPFTGPYDSAVGGRFYPRFTVLHRIPENRKSQFICLRPDLGTEMVRFDDLEELHAILAVVPPVINKATGGRPLPRLSVVGHEHMARWLSWDMAATSADARSEAA